MPQLPLVRMLLVTCVVVAYVHGVFEATENNNNNPCLVDVGHHVVAYGRTTLCFWRL